MAKIYYYEQKTPLHKPGMKEWLPRIMHDWPPILHKGDQPIRGLKELDGELHKGWCLIDFHDSYGVKGDD